MKGSVLFVDDDANVLSALRRMLHDLRDEWDMTFAEGGAQALALLAERPFDVVVSDMRMPCMDGAALLAEVRRLRPQTVRIILSGHSDRDMILQTVKPAHQFLHKPVHPEELRRLVGNALRLKALFMDEDLKTIFAKIDTLPSAPTIYVRLTEELAKDSASAKCVAELISDDLGMSAGILKLVNSAFFGQRARITSVVHAVNLLGTEVIKSLILYLHVFTKFDRTKYPDFDLDKLWRHCLTTSQFARAIAAAQGASQSTQDDCYIAGLLHDLGKLVMAANFGAEYPLVLARCRAENRTVWSVEKEALPASHAEAGAYMLGLWGLSEQVVAAVFHHHEPSRAPDALKDGFTPLAAVHAANVLDHEQVVINPGFARNPLDTTFLEACGCLGNIDIWRAACAQALPQEDLDGSQDSVR